MLQPGEKIAAATNFEGRLIVYGEHGTVLEMSRDHTNQYAWRVVGDLAVPSPKPTRR